MKKLSDVIRHGGAFWAEEDGPTVTEYAVLLVLIVFSLFTTLALIGTFLKNSFTDLSSGIPNG